MGLSDKANTDTESRCARYSINQTINSHNIVTPSTKTERDRDPFNGPLSRTTWVSRYQKGKTSLDFTEARDSEWQWHQLGHMQLCISLQTDNYAMQPTTQFLQAGCPSCRPTNSVTALKAYSIYEFNNFIYEIANYQYISLLH